MQGELDEIHPFDPKVLADSAGYDRRLRSEAPVYRNPHTGVFLVSDFEHVVEVLGDPERFSSRHASATGIPGAAAEDPQFVEFQKQSYPIVHTLRTADPPDHARYRRRVERAFSSRSLEAIRAETEKLCHDAIDVFEEAGSFDAVADYAGPLPFRVLATQLGVPADDLPRFRRWTDGFTSQLGGVASGDGALETMRRILEFQHYFAVRIDVARHRPCGDVLSDLVGDPDPGSEPLDLGESLSVLQQLLVVGSEAAAHALAEGLRLLVRHPDVQARLGRDATLLDRFVEEVLRLATPVQNLWRRSRRTTRLGGVEVPEGAALLLRLASANRDESMFPDPDRLDLGREPLPSPLGFGAGIHACPLAAQVRAQMRVAFGCLLARTEDLRLAPGQEEPRYRPGILLRGLREWRVAFEPRTR